MRAAVYTAVRFEVAVDTAVRTRWDMKNLRLFSDLKQAHLMARNQRDDQPCLMPPACHLFDCDVLSELFSDL